MWLKIRIGGFPFGMNFSQLSLGSRTGVSCLNIKKKIVRDPSNYSNSDIVMDRAITTNEKIKKLEAELALMNEKKSDRLKTTACGYGAGKDMEVYRMTQLNKRKNVELQPIPRRPKGK